MRAVREWLRVSCRPFHEGVSDVRCRGVKWFDGEDGETFSFAKGGVCSVVVPLLDAKKRDVRFELDNQPVIALTIEWPHGAPGPTVLFAHA